MKFKLCDTWWITSDKHCFKLCRIEKRINKDTGEVEEILNPEMYFSRLKGLISAWITEKLKESKSKKTKELINDVKEINKELDKIYGKINKGFDIYIDEFTGRKR